MAKEQLGKVDDILDLPFSFCCLELPSYQQLSRDPGVSLREGGGSEVLEESLHVPAALRPLLLDERNVQGSRGQTFSLSISPMLFRATVIAVI